jgi:hypothetical protein
MEKLKWIILGILLIVLVVVIFRSPDVDENETTDNHVRLTVRHNEIINTAGKRILVDKGDYILYLNEFQKTEGKGVGWHISFSRPAGEQEMIFVFDAVDTSGTIFHEHYPQYVFHSPFQKFIPGDQPPLLRGSFKLGYQKRISQTMFHEDLIPLLEFSCRIDSVWGPESGTGFQMRFAATHSGLLHQVYGLKYYISGSFHIENATLTKRIIQ